jgi:predicted aspartyl protease
VSAKTPYSTEYTPPAPVLAIRVSAPSGGTGVALLALVDTGADVSVLPRTVAESLALPHLSNLRLQGVTGVPESVRVHAARVEVGGKSLLAEVACFGSEIILGRDILNGFVLRLDGPRTALELAAPGGRGPAGRLRRVRA